MVLLLRLTCMDKTMKTLLVCVTQISLFCLCLCLAWQPSPNHDSPPQLSYEENIFKKCKEVNGDITTRNFLDEETLLCFGLNVFSQRFPGGVEARAVLDGVEKKPDADICKHFQEMRLDSTLEKSNESIAVYNRQFRDVNICERACLDVVGNVNPLCSIILLLSRHSRRNTIGSDTQHSSTTLPGDKAHDGDNEVSNVNVASVQSNFAEEVSNTIPGKQKSKVNDAAGVTDEQKTEMSIQGQAHKEQKLVSKDGENKSHIQKIESPIPEQTSGGIISTSKDDVNKLHGQKQETVEIGTGSDKEKPKVSGEGEELASETANIEPATNGIPEEKGHTNPNISTPSDTSKNTANSKKKPKETTEEETNVVSKNENQVKTGNIPEQSSVVVPDSSAGDKKEEAAVTKPKVEEKFSATEDKLTSKKLVAGTGPQKEESISHVPNVEEGKDIDDGQKSQANHKETENPPPKEVELQISSKALTEVMPKSNTDEQKTNQDNKKAGGNENAETAPPSGVDNAQKTISDEMQFTDDAGDGVAELDTHFSVEAGELNDNTEFTSGGGTGVDYVRPDVLETDKNDMDAGTVLIHEKYEDDDSHFFAYFMTTMVFCIVGYLLFHNKQKILALALEGRARRGRRRPNTSGYRKLDSNLEEAISSSKSASVTQVIY